MVFWSRSRQEVWRKGDTSGDRQFVREALLRLRRRRAAVRRRAGGQGRLPHRRAHLLLPRASGADAMRIRPSRDEFRALAARPHGRARCGASCSADLETPVAAFARSSATSPGFLLESVEHGERWSRCSFVGRDPSATLAAARRPASRSTGTLPSTVPARPAASSPRSRRCWRRTGRRSLPDLPPLHGGLVGYLGYDVVREVERLPDVPARRPRHCPTRCCRHRLSSPPSTTGASGSRSSRTCPSLGLDATPSSTPPTTTRSAGSSAGRRRLARPLDEPLSSRPTPDEPLPDVASSMPRRAVPAGRRGRQGAHPRRRHLPGRAGPALRPRPRRRPVRRLPGAAPGQPEPVHVLRAPPGGHARRVVARADGAAARRHA